MKISHSRARIRAQAAILTLAFGSVAFAAPIGPVYNAIEDALPGNVASIGNEAYAGKELGDHVALTGTAPRRIVSVDVVLSSWGCETGAWYLGDCATTPGSGFTHPLTLNLYEVDNSGEFPAVGDLIATTTQEFFIPFRPSVDLVNCTGGRWYDSGADTCYNGLANVVRFDLPSTEVPEEVIYGIAYDTSHHGYSPIGEGASCYPNCGYDSLNVGLTGSAVGNPSEGTDVEVGTLFWYTTYLPFYCEPPQVASFRRDADCWPEPYSTWGVRFNIATPPTTRDDCMNDGWRDYTVPRVFKNQGDCIKYVETGK